MNSYPFIASMPFGEYTPENFAQHLRDIQSHTRRVAEANKKRKKERAAAYAQAKPKKYVSFRYSPKGTPIITIRNRDPKYVLRSEIEALLREWPDALNDILKKLTEKNIEIRDEA